jgi:[ribosomal protein S5]-alanine N-acetyltransferase
MYRPDTAGLRAALPPGSAKACFRLKSFASIGVHSRFLTSRSCRTQATGSCISYNMGPCCAITQVQSDSNMNRSRGAAAEVYLRKPERSDADGFIRLVRSSREFHRGLVSPPATAGAFADYVARCARDDFEGFLICRKSDSMIVGVVNFSQIFRGGFQNAYMGYYVGAEFTGRGYMTQGLRLALDYAFRRLKLHRVEANIQPENVASIALVKKLGFRLEGYSPRYLKISGHWRDHERWAILREEWPGTKHRSLPRANS